jgi:hypothetical protein
MKSSLIAIVSAALLGCGAGGAEALTPDDPGYFNAEIKVVEMKYLLDDDGNREVFAISGDGSVMADGKVVCRVTGTRIETPQGQLMVTIDAAGNVTGPRAAPDARFNARNQLVTRHAIVTMVNVDTVPGGRRRGIDYRTENEAKFGEGRMALLWNDGTRVSVRGHFTVFDRRATRLSLLLATILLMRPGTLDQPHGSG